MVVHSNIMDNIDDDDAYTFGTRHQIPKETVQSFDSRTADKLPMVVREFSTYDARAHRNILCESYELVHQRPKHPHGDEQA